MEPPNTPAWVTAIITLSGLFGVPSLVKLYLDRRVAIASTEDARAQRTLDREARIDAAREALFAELRQDVDRLRTRLDAATASLVEKSVAVGECAGRCSTLEHRVAEQQEELVALRARIRELEP